VKYLQIILNLPVNQPFTYSYSPDENEKPELIPMIGKRAEIMFGNRKTSGFIIDILDSIPPSCPVDSSKIRPIKRIIDKEPLFDKELIEIAKWISHYYLCTLGEAIFAMIPSGRRETSAGGFSFENELTQIGKTILSDEQNDCVKHIIEHWQKDENNNFSYKNNLIEFHSILYIFYHIFLKLSSTCFQLACSYQLPTCRQVHYRHDRYDLLPFENHSSVFGNT
jgi:primosomal protein N'